MMPTIGVVLVRHQKETRSVASGPAFYRLLPPKRQDIAVSVQQRHATPNEPQYEIKSHKTDHVALHKAAVLRRLG